MSGKTRLRTGARHGQPEIRGYTKEYLEASSPRREQIKDHLREQGIDGAAVAQIAAHHTRDRKELLSPEEVLQRHRELAAQYGCQADRVVARARERGQHQIGEPEMQAQRAVTWARDHVFERSAVHDCRAILETALVRGMGETTYARIRQEFERRIEAGEFREVSHIGAGQQYTTAVMVRIEREVIVRMREGNRCNFNDPMLVSPQVRIATEDRHPELNASQLMLSLPDRLMVEPLWVMIESLIFALPPLLEKSGTNPALQDTRGANDLVRLLRREHGMRIIPRRRSCQERGRGFPPSVSASAAFKA